MFLHVKVLQKLESVDHWLTIQSAHFWIHRTFQQSEYIFFLFCPLPSLAVLLCVCHPKRSAIRCHSSITCNIQVGSFQQIKLVRHFQVLVWVCLKMKEQSKSHVTFWFQNMEIVSFLGVIDFDTSKGYNLSTCISRIWVSGSDLQIDHTNLRPRRSQRVNESMNRRIGGTVAPHPLWHSICNTLRIPWCLLRI